MSLKTFQELGVVSGGGPLNSTSEDVHEITVINEGPGTAFLAPKSGDAHGTNRNELGEADVVVLPAGEQVRFSIQKSEQWYYGCGADGVRLRVIYA
jgi:hypothetical protein